MTRLVLKVYLAALCTVLNGCVVFGQTVINRDRSDYTAEENPMVVAPG